MPEHVAEETALRPFARVVAEPICERIRAGKQAGQTNADLCRRYNIGRITLSRIIYRRGAYAAPEEKWESGEEEW